MLRLVLECDWNVIGIWPDGGGVRGVRDVMGI